MAYFILLIPLLLGWFSGWFINYLSDVLPLTRTLSQPVCQNCQAPYTWVDYIFMRSCSSCLSNRNLRTWGIQLLLPVASLLIWLFPRPILSYPIAMIVLIFFSIVAIIDLEHRVVLNQVALVGAFLGLGLGIFLRSGRPGLGAILSTLVGGAAGFGIMLALYFLGILYVKRLARKRGLPPDEVALGFGDVNLAGILGLMLGWPAIIMCLFIAIIGGGFISLIIIAGMLITKKYKSFTAIPYAPFLLLAALYILFS